jgi:DnaK suppressor protein
MNSQLIALKPPSPLPTIDQLIDLELRVIEEIASLKSEIHEAMLEIEAVSPWTSIGQLSRNSILQTYEMAVEAQRRREARLLLLERALDRMDCGEYGECETCREGISWARLDAQPEARYCASCVS